MTLLNFEDDIDKRCRPYSTFEWKSPFGMQGFVMFELLLRKVRFQSLDGRNRKHHFLSY